MLKKTVVAGVLIALVLMATVAMAAPTRPVLVKPVRTVWSAEVINNEIIITVITPKKGSSFTDEWTGADALSTERVVKPRRIAYVATASLTPTETGTYVVSYEITMVPGKSKVVRFVGEVTLELEVEVDAGVVTLVSAAPVSD